VDSLSDYMYIIFARTNLMRVRAFCVNVPSVWNGPSWVAPPI